MARRPHLRGEVSHHQKSIANQLLPETFSTDQQLENSALIGGVHALVDLVHTAEGHRRQLLQRQHVQGRRHAALSSGLKNNSVDHKKFKHFFRT